MNAYIAFSILALVPALTGCRPAFHYNPTAATQKRLPFRAVVWVFKDQTPDSADGLTRGGSRWRPWLSMDDLSGALAAELEARLTQSAEAVEETLARRISEEESKGTRVFVYGTVEEAAWIRSPSDSGSYRLKVALSATLARPGGTDLQWFWTKTVEVEQLHTGRPVDDLAGVMRKAFGPAVEDMGRALEKQSL